jgi:hypothetical protein
MIETQAKQKTRADGNPIQVCPSRLSSEMEHDGIYSEVRSRISALVACRNYFCGARLTIVACVEGRGKQRPQMFGR